MTDHMSSEEFRRHGHEVIDWIAEYMERVEELPVTSRVEPGEIRGRLPSSPPTEGESFRAMLRDVEEIVLPGLTHWQHPGFFAYFPSNASGPSILGELLSAGLAVQGMLWSTSPACTDLETHVLDWLAEMLGLPARFRSDGSGGGVIQDTASSATLCALVAARERASGGETNRAGCEGGLTACCVYCSEEAHSSVEKAVRIAGIGSENLRPIPTDGRFRMRPEALAAAIDDDLAAGRLPCMVAATVGTTSSLAVDPLVPIGEICADREVWLHVDAAMAGTAAVCPEHRSMHEGLDRVDSYCVNPHKWMLTNFDCDAFWVADREALVSALSILPEYLRDRASESGEVIDYRDWQIPLGRRFRALKLWFVIRWYGVEGIRALVRHHVALAAELASWIEESDDFELVVPRSLNLVCFRHRGGERVHARILERVNGAGEVFLTHTRLAGDHTLRLCVGQARTERRHVERAWELVRSAATD